MPDHHHHGANAPGLAAPQSATRAAAGLTADHKDEAPRLAGAEGFRNQRQADVHDCAQAVADGKRFATLQARLALLGFALTRADDAGDSAAYTVTRWNLARDVATLDAVAAFASMVGAPA